MWNLRLGQQAKKPVKLGAGTAVLCPYEGASDVASGVGAGAGFGSAGGDGGSGSASSGEVWSADCSWEVRMVWRQELAP